MKLISHVYINVIIERCIIYKYKGVRYHRHIANWSSNVILESFMVLHVNSQTFV